MYPTTYCSPLKANGSVSSVVDAGAPVLPEPVTRDNAVLLAVDCQVAALWDLEFGAMRKRLADLARSAQRSELPMIVTGIDVDNRGPVIPELTSAHPDSRVITRSASNAWNDARVRDAVRDSGRSTLIVVGSAADIGVALCAMSAAADGMSVYAILEAPGSPPSSARWFGDRLIVTTCDLVRLAIEKKTNRPGLVGDSSDTTAPRRSLRSSQELRITR